MGPRAMTVSGSSRGHRESFQLPLGPPSGTHGAGAGRRGRCCGDLGGTTVHGSDDPYTWCLGPALSIMPQQNSVSVGLFTHWLVT